MPDFLKIFHILKKFNCLKFLKFVLKFKQTFLTNIRKLYQLFKRFKIFFKEFLQGNLFKYF